MYILDRPIVNIRDFIGKTFTNVYADGDQEIHFVIDETHEYIMGHNQCCCENVYIEDVNSLIVDTFK